MGTANLFHITKTATFDVVESYISPVDFVLNDHLVKQGTWLTTIQVNDDNLWSLIKSGDICSVSISAMANKTPVTDETRNTECQLKTQWKPKHQLSNIDFTQDSAHIALVSKEQGHGANGHHYA